MSSKKKANDANAREEIQEQAKGVLRRAFEMLTGQFKEIAADFARLEERRRKVREEMERGGRKTSGRIV